MRRYEREEVKPHVFITSVLDSGERTSSLPGHFNPREKHSVSTG
jgi:hypothetical protein